MKKNKRIKDRDFLSFAKQQGGICCVCRWMLGDLIQADELHHFGDKGMGQKSHDYEVARVCKNCHDRYQGKRRMAFLRMDRIDILESLERDALTLLIAYVEENKC